MTTVAGNTNDNSFIFILCDNEKKLKYIQIFIFI